MGLRAAQLLIDRLDDATDPVPQTVTELIDVTLILRHSTGPVRHVR